MGLSCRRTTRSFFNEHQIEYTTIPVDHHGDVMRAVFSVGDGNKPIMLCGHDDTVFPEWEVYRRLFSISDDKAFGQIVADIKSGLV